jgi:hypothetical protein
MELANLALHEGKQDLMHEGLNQVHTAIAATREVHDELAWARALDVSARLHLALDQQEEAYAVSLQAMQLMQSNPWLPMPQAHLHTHYLVLRTRGREAEAKEYLQRAHEWVMSVTGKLTDVSLREGWLGNVRVNREILSHCWEYHA